MSPEFEVFIPGRPAPQGSKTRTRWGMRDANPGTLHPWRDAVRATVHDALPDGWTPWDCAVAVGVVFTLPRPASLPRSVRHPMRARSGDIDKLARALLDGCTDAGLWVDDARVVFLASFKVFLGSPMAAAMPGAQLAVEPVQDGGQ